MVDGSALLKRFKPRLVYDSAEAFWADDAAMMTDGVGCTLRQGKRTLLGGRGMKRLSLDALRAEYEDGGSAAETDRICLGSRKYRTAYSRLCEERPELRHRMYGRWHDGE